MDPVEKMIQQAMERGDFDNLPGAGKPLDLRENPFVPEEWRLAYRMLEDSGFSPAVVEEDKALRAGIEALETRLQKFERRWSQWRRALPWSEGQNVERTAARDAFLRAYEEEIRTVNSRTHMFNAVAPGAMQRGTLSVPSLLEAAAARLPLPPRP